MSFKRTEKEILKDLEKLCTSPGYAYALAFLAKQTYYTDDSCLKNLEIMEQHNSMAPMPSEIDLLLGMMLKTEKNTAFLSINQNIISDYIDRTMKILRGLEKYLKQFAFDAMDDIVSSINSGNLVGLPINANIIKEACLYGSRTVYDFQYKKFAPERYKNDDAWIKDNKKFGISDIEITLDAIDKMLKEKIIEIDSLTNQKLGYNRRLNYYINNTSQLFFIEKNKIIKKTGLSEEVIENIINAFSVEMPCNKKFQRIGDDNKITRKPIIKFDDEKIVLFQCQSLARSFYESPFMWMTKGKKINKKAGINRGNFTENVIFELFENVFHQKIKIYKNIGKVYKNVIIYDRGNKVNHKHEIDILVVYGDVAIVVQAKSKQMGNMSQKGSHKHMENDFKSAIKHAYEQAYESARCLLNQEFILKNKKKKILNIKRNFKEVFILCATADQYLAVELQRTFFLKPKEHKIISFPYITDIFILDVLCEFVSEPIKFLDFIRKRTLYFENIHFVNELSILGHYFKHDLHLTEYNGSVIFVNPSSSFYIHEPFIARRENYPLERSIRGKDFEGNCRTFP